jgi:transcriptional regulator with XRE-family HTH domain
MEKASNKFGKRLRDAMQAAGYEAKPSVLEREFNLRYMGQPMTLHGVRRWLLGESLPRQDKMEALAEWLRIPPQELRYGAEIEKRVMQVRARWEEAIGYQERDLFEAYLNLPVPQRKIVREVIQTFAKAFPINATEKENKRRKKPA